MSSAVQPNANNFLQTQRLYMRPVNADLDLPDCEELYGRVEENRFFESGPKSAQETAQYINEFATQQFCDFPPFGMYAVFEKEGNAFIGHADLFTIDQENPGDMEIAFILKKECQGKKYGTEIAQALKEFGHSMFLQENPRAKRLVATAHPDNIASWKILEKLGMQFVEQVEKFNAPRKVYEFRFSKPKEIH